MEAAIIVAEILKKKLPRIVTIRVNESVAIEYEEQPTAEGLIPDRYLAWLNRR